MIMDMTMDMIMGLFMDIVMVIIHLKRLKVKLCMAFSFTFLQTHLEVLVSSSLLC